MDKLLHTSLFRAILKSLNRKVVSEKRLQTYFLKFARCVTALCDDTDYLSALHTLNYTQIQFRFLLFRIHEPSISPPPYVHRFIDMAIEFIRMEKELLYYRLEHPQYFISGSAALLVEGAFCDQRFGNSLRARSDDPEAFAAGRRYGRSVQSGRSGLRGYVACQTRRSDRCQTPCSGTQERSHKIYRCTALFLE